MSPLAPMLYSYGSRQDLAFPMAPSPFGEIVLDVMATLPSATAWPWHVAPPALPELWDRMMMPLRLLPSATRLPLPPMEVLPMEAVLSGSPI